MSASAVHLNRVPDRHVVTEVAEMQYESLVRHAVVFATQRLSVRLQSSVAALHVVVRHENVPEHEGPELDPPPPDEAEPPARPPETGAPPPAALAEPPPVAAPPPVDEQLATSVVPAVPHSKDAESKHSRSPQRVAFLVTPLMVRVQSQLAPGSHDETARARTRGIINRIADTRERGRRRPEDGTSLRRAHGQRQNDPFSMCLQRLRRNLRGGPLESTTSP